MATRRYIQWAGRLTVVLVAGLALAGPTVGQGKFPYVGVITEDRVNIRSGGGPNYVIMATAGKGEMVEVEALGGAKDEWLKCLYPKPLLAYITTDYVKKVDDRTGVLEAQNVFLRPLPTVKRYPLRTLSAGTRLRITGEKDGFYEVVVPEGTNVWIHQKYVRYFGSKEQYTRELAKIREEAMKKFDSPAPAEAASEAKTAAAAADAGKTAGTATEPSKEQAAKEAREALMVRLAALRQLYEKHDQAKDPAGLKGVQQDLEKLETEAASLEDEYSKYMVSYNVGQLITKVKLAILNAEAARKVAEPVQDPNSIKPVKGVIEIAGWLKKESRPFTQRVIFKLEKGNVVLYYLTADRYDLDKFVNKHVSVTGKILPRKNLTDNVYLEVVRLKVLSQ